MVFDFQVNAGANASKLLQNVINDLGAQPPLAVDGDIGPGTLAALGRMDQTRSIGATSRGASLLPELGRRRPSLGKFLKGWLNRVNAFPDL